MITLLALKWRRQSTGHQLPSAIEEYTPEHVNRWCRMLRANLTIPHKFLCITDDPADIHECPTLPLWELEEAGGCFHRLRLFDTDALPSEIASSLGDRFGWLDLDCVVTGNVDHIFSRTEPVVMNARQHESKPAQLFNGALCLMDRDTAPEVWRSYATARKEAAAYAARLNEANYMVGSDQLWISLMAPWAATVGYQDGIREAGLLRRRAPDAGARMVLFSGARDPSNLSRFGWAREYWK
jgi:hypothetical protein